MCDECEARIEELSEKLETLGVRHEALVEMVLSGILISDAKTLDAFGERLSARLNGAVARGKERLANELRGNLALLNIPSPVLN